MRCLTKALAPRRIRINTIHPGPVDNEFQHKVEAGIGSVIGRDATQMIDEMIPLGRHASAEEVARTVLYLACDQAGFTTGAMLMVDGGMSVWLVRPIRPPTTCRRHRRRRGRSCAFRSPPGAPASRHRSPRTAPNS